MDSQVGELEFREAFTNEIGGIMKGMGTIDLPVLSKLTIKGTLAPGSSPGKLTLLGDFKQEADGIVEIEIDGLTAETEYDVLNITGSGTFNGTLEVIMGFLPTVGDQFDVITAGNITACSFPTFVETDFNGTTHRFDVHCLTNKVQLEFTGAALPVELTQFTAKSQHEFVQLNWKTASETNNEGFEIWQSTNSQNWEMIGFKGREGHFK